MFYRKILKNLQAWQLKENRKPLILRGARQVGKTTAVELFSKSFDNYIKLDLEIFKDREIFKENYTIQELYQAIIVNKGISLKPGTTLLFVDEIQNSPVAIKMLRYFYEQMNEIYVIAAGSLLEILLANEPLSFPVGRVEFLYMYPLTFDEFLNAKNEEKLIEELSHIPVQRYAHVKLLTLFHQYSLLGGMPEIVQTWLQNDEITALSSIFESIITSYLDDSEKYARSQTMRFVLRHCVETIPTEVGNRIKFQGFGNSNYRSREVGEALRLIEKAMIIYLIYPSTRTQAPLQIDYKKSPKLQYIDTGLLNYALGIQREFFKQTNLNTIYRGIIAEHIVRQELLAEDLTTNKKLPFWTREMKQANSEVDLLYQFQNLAIPIEVKSGKSGSLRSLQQFMQRSEHPFAVRFYNGEFALHEVKIATGLSFQLLNLPYYLAGKLPEYLEALINKNLP